MSTMNQPPPQNRQDSSITISMVAVSDDSYIRLLFAELQAIRLTHLISGLDADYPAPISSGAMPTTITGYTEMVSTTTPTITVGWDWQMDAAHNHIRLRRISEPRSNLMLQDISRVDLGAAKTIALLESFIDALSWQIEVQSHIDLRYT
jgi:hypothetical protein